jgi:2-polyprenyl-3-methyl-5-hydroxy-6-metoxy-1,4-benzoquinol methylase
MLHHNKCPLCFSEKILLHHTCTDNFISKEVFELYKCSVCGFEFTQGYPEEAQIGRYYESDDYISHSNTSLGLFNKLYKHIRKVMLKRKGAIVQRVTGLKSGSILDIGSGTGHFAVTMKKAGWSVKGIEINEQARQKSISHFGLEICTPEDISKLNAGSFDCITLWHVLEHFHDPYKYASDIINLLKPGGTCLVALPNCNSCDAKYYGKFWAAYDVPRHLWHFNPDTFRLFCEKTGFMVVELKNLPFDVFYISLLSEKYKGALLPFLTGMTKALIFWLLSAFKRNKSSSVIYILKKQNQ